MPPLRPCRADSPQGESECPLSGPVGPTLHKGRVSAPSPALPADSPQGESEP